MDDETLVNLQALMDLTQVSNDKSGGDKLNSIANSLNNLESGWLRSGERWEAQSSRFENKREDIFNLAVNLGFIHEIEIPKKDMVYDRAILLGAPSFVVQKRLEHMIKCWIEGARWKVIVFLGSDRSLDDGPESDRQIKDKIISSHFLPTEMGMMRYIYSNSLDKAPHSFQSVPVLFINTTSDVLGRRAVTEDTISQWLKEDEMNQVSSILVFSNQPFVLYQEQVVKHALKQSGVSVLIHTVGVQVSHFASVALLLDTIARYIFFLSKVNPPV